MTVEDVVDGATAPVEAETEDDVLVEGSMEDLQAALNGAFGGAPGSQHNYIKFELKNIGIVEMQSPDSSQQEMFINAYRFLISTGLLGKPNASDKDVAFI